MKQLALGISPPPQPTLENFVPGANAELLARVRALAAGALAEGVLYVWGEPGSGRSHLLAAAKRAAPGLRVADDVQRLDPAAQVDLFHAINGARDSGSGVLAAGDAPPARLALREDLRSRLAWGLVYRLHALTDDDRAVFLGAEARRRGLRVGDDVIRYLLARARRDLPSLLGILDALDRASLERQRPVTLPLVREVLQIADE
ncbi:MAG TPA: DnaA/Hda family protein [Burkholderiales bacterium]|nr:DnaA/Hda family protein [Burkholderiales bacterium]